MRRFVAGRISANTPPTLTREQPDSTMDSARCSLPLAAMAKSLRDSLVAKNISLSHSECLEIVARQFGFADWNVLSSKIDLETGARTPPRQSPGIELQPAIPILRIFSLDKAKEFYVDFLGFAFDWGHERENAEQPGCHDPHSDDRTRCLPSGAVEQELSFRTAWHQLHTL